MDDVHTPRQVMRPPSKTRWRLTRLIATLGVLLVTAGMYTSAIVTDVRYGFHAPTFLTQTWMMRNLLFLAVTPPSLARLPLPLALGLDVALSALLLGGLALLPLLWRPLSRKGLAFVRWVYAVWLALLAVLAVTGLLALRQAVPLAFSLVKHFGAFGSYHVLPGVVVFPLGALVMCVALALLFSESAPASLPTPAPRTGWQWVATLSLTLGALVWLVGFYLMPQAITAACPPITFSVTQFAHGACAGIDSDQVLQWAWYSGLNPVAALLYTLARNFELLVALGAITALGGWTRLLSVATLAWLAIWPALAFGVALVALQGVGVVALSGFSLTSDTGGGWHAAPGMFMTFAGIALVALGQLGLWREWARQRAATPEGLLRARLSPDSSH